MKNLSLLYTLLLISQLNAQEYFNQIYETEGRATPGEVNLIDGKFYVRDEPLSGVHNPKFLIFDYNFDLLFEKEISHFQCDMSSGLIMANANDSIFMYAPHPEPRVNILDLNLDSLSFVPVNTYFEEEQTHTRLSQIIETESGLYISGSIFYELETVGVARKGLLIKLQRDNFDIQTYITFQLESNISTNFTWLRKGNDGNIWSSISAETYPFHQRGLVKFSPDLELLSTYIIPNISDDRENSGHIEFSNGNILLTGEGNHDNEAASSEPALYCTNSDGTLLWSLEEYEIFTPRNVVNYWGLIATQDGNAIICSDYYDWDPYNQDETWFEGGRLRKVSPEGEIIWDRIFHIPFLDGTTTRTSIISKVIEEPNGNLFAYGWIESQDYDSQHPEYTDWDYGHWYIRTDSEGCLIENCFVSTDSPIQEEKWQLSPNPSSGEVQIISGSDGTQEVIEASIYNLQGQIVHTEKIPAGQNTLSLTGIPQGVYIVHLENKEGLRQTERIILQY